jgi:hypothetical protein
MLTGPRRKFCEGIVSGLSAAEAYRAAYPRSSADSARGNAFRLSRDEEIKAEIAALRAKGNKEAGSAVLTYAEKRGFFASVVQGQAALLPHDSPLWQSIKHTKDGTEYRLPCKLRAIELDNDLAGDGSEANANDEIAALMARLNAPKK